jgi:tetratricopeptide (TPR) repeat protein
MSCENWEDAEPRIDRAERLMEQCRWDEALRELQGAIEFDPDNFTALSNLGLTLQQLGRHEEAIETYERMLELEPGSLPAMQEIGCSLHALGRYAEAIARFESIERLNPGFEQSYCPRILCYAELGDHQKAEEMFYLARLWEPTCPVCLHNMALSLLKRGEVTRGKACLRQAIEAQPLYFEARATLADVLAEEGDDQQAVQLYEDAIRLQALGRCDVLTVLKLASVLQRLKRMSEARHWLEDALRNHPDHAPAHVAMGDWYRQNGRMAEAEASFRRASVLDPTLEGAHLGLARVSMSAGNRHAAHWHAQLEVRLAREAPEILLQAASLLVRLDDLPAATLALRKLVRQRAWDAKAWADLGYVLLKRGLADDGISATRRAIRIDRAHVPALINLAIARYRQGDFRACAATLQRALRVAPDDMDLKRLRLRLLVRWSISGIVRRLRR